ncbi:MAG: Asp-tRNA(Asn)/Glu-tRNA(Gln) amidotransferase subunit GatB [Anaerolineaceae bacterium]|nr:Asp-tRNA(Asn)/Glu-tRNA(Gln) amidotransferase subunit GatB [Anaerolineaceae bacterium]
MTEYLATIGLETHIQLNTKTKAFCSCRVDSRDDAPNINICPVCSGQPGALPSPNAEMVRKAVRLCLAVHAQINQVSYFDRKNYLYADMPDGYQVTQNDLPIGVGGYLDVDMENGKTVRVRIDNLHMEEDAGKTRNEGGVRLIDFNRAGVPLVEMVTRPDLHSADEAAAYLMRLRQLIRWIGVSEGNMEKAQLRCDANVSVALVGAAHPGRKCEIKNINSIEAVRKAIGAEIGRQIGELEGGRKVEQWTIEWDNEARELRKMRSKENAVDYRFFREPNLMPVIVSDEMLKAIRADLPELPRERRMRFIADYGLPEYDARLLTAERETADYFEELCRFYGKDAKRASNWMLNEILRLMHDSVLSAAELNLGPAALADIIRMVDEKKVTPATGKELIDLVQESGKSPAEIVEERGLVMVSDDQAIRELCERIVRENPKETAAFRAGKETLLGWFTGQVMRETKGKADAKKAGEVLKKLLSEE